MAWRSVLAGALAALIVGLSTAGPAEARRGLTTGFADILFQSPDQVDRDTWLDRAAGARAGMVLVFAVWRDVVDGKPAVARDPADPAYDFSRIDGAIRGARARALRPMITVNFAPSWAEGKGRDPEAPPGTWKPRPGDLGDFLFALASRYSGKFPDPQEPGRNLPRVRYFEDWNEPNLATFLTPQWKGKRLVSARHYRRMNNASWAAIKSVRKGNKLVAAGTAPYGGDPPGGRSRPLRFWREVFCLEGRRSLRAGKCVRRKRRAHIDVMAHHPINTSGGPRRGALHPDDASSADMGRIRRVLRAAERSKRVLPRGRRPLWASEFWWESDPPDPEQGWPLRKHARFIAESLYLAWKGGASAAIALQLRDSEYTEATKLSRSVTGAYFFDGEPKPALRAYRFPFVAERKGRRAVQVWGKAPEPGRLVIQRKRGGGWRRIGVLRADRSRIFTGRIRLRGKAKLRAKAAGERSLPSPRV